MRVEELLSPVVSSSPTKLLAQCPELNTVRGTGRAPSGSLMIAEHFIPRDRLCESDDTGEPGISRFVFRDSFGLVSFLKLMVPHTLASEPWLYSRLWLRLSYRLGPSPVRVFTLADVSSPRFTQPPPHHPSNYPNVFFGKASLHNLT